MYLVFGLVYLVFGIVYLGSWDGVFGIWTGVFVKAGKKFLLDLQTSSIQEKHQQQNSGGKAITTSSLSTSTYPPLQFIKKNIYMDFLKNIWISPKNIWISSKIYGFPQKYIDFLKNILILCPLRLLLSKLKKICWISSKYIDFFKIY